MADNTKQNPKLNELAFALFGQRSGFAHGQSAENVARRCFMDASEFLRVADEISTGGVPAIADANPLDPAFARNLKKTHPINLMSREWGDLKKVIEVFNELEANPAATTYEPLGWGMPEVNQARALFPAVIERSKKVAKATA